MIISKTEWLDWRSQDISKEFIKAVLEKREQIKEGLANGQSSGDDLQQSIGRCIALMEVLEFFYRGPETQEEEESGGS